MEVGDDTPNAEIVTRKTLKTKQNKRPATRESHKTRSSDRGINDQRTPRLTKSQNMNISRQNSTCAFRTCSDHSWGLSTAIIEPDFSANIFLSSLVGAGFRQNLTSSSAEFDGDCWHRHEKDGTRSVRRWLRSWIRPEFKSPLRARWGRHVETLCDASAKYWQKPNSFQCALGSIGV